MTIAAPNGTQPIWSSTQTQPAKGTPRVWVAFSRKMPSRVILPVVPGVSVPTPLPPCPGLRNEPCRTYTPLANRVAKVPKAHKRPAHKRPAHKRPAHKRSHRTTTRS